MKYRLMFRSDFESGASKIVLIQKMNNFNHLFAATISIDGALKADSHLSQAVLCDELNVEFEKGQILRMAALN